MYWHPYSLAWPFLLCAYDRLMTAHDIHKEAHLQKYIKRQPRGHSTQRTDDTVHLPKTRASGWFQIATDDVFS